MTIDVYTATGSKKGTATLPKSLFEAAINEGLMHQAVVRQQSNRRASISHSKTRGEIQGSTRKLFRQKGTGRARRGSVRANVLRGGNKAFGPRNNTNYVKDMPRTMRRAALKSCLTSQAQNGIILGLESYPETIKTKDLSKLLEKMPTDLGRKILIVTAGKHDQLSLSARNIDRVKVIQAAYLNPEDVLGARHIVFMVDALKKAEEVFGENSGSRGSSTSDSSEGAKKETKSAKEEKKPAAKKPAAKKEVKEKTEKKTDSKKDDTPTDS